MGVIDFCGTIHIKQRQTSKEPIANVNAIAYSEWTLKGPFCTRNPLLLHRSIRDHTVLFPVMPTDLSCLLYLLLMYFASFALPSASSDESRIQQESTRHSHVLG